MIARGMPTLSYGLRGVTALEIKVTGAKMDLHSGVFGGAVANPITALAQLLATLHDREGRVAIAGFYDKVKPLEDWEREAWRKLPVDGDKEVLKETGRARTFWRSGLQFAGANLGAADCGDQWNRRRLPRAGNQDRHRQSRDGEADFPSRSRTRKATKFWNWRRAHLRKHLPPGSRWKLPPATADRGI